MLKWLGIDPKNLSVIQMLIFEGVVIFVLGFACAAFIFDRDRIEGFVQSRKIASLGQLERVLKHPVIAWAPSIEGDPLHHLRNPKSELMEAVASIASAIQFQTGRKGTLLLVTSGGPGEGKSTIANGLARTQARKGLRVLLVDADLRRPSVHWMMQVKSAPGLSNRALQKTDWAEIIQQTSVENLEVIAAGDIPPSPDVTIDQLEITDFWKEVLTKYDWVIVDAPPAMGLADAPAIARCMTAILFVARYRMASARVILSAFNRLVLQDGQRIIIAGNALPSKGYGYGYGYAYTYNYGGARNDEEGNETDAAREAIQNQQPAPAPTTWRGRLTHFVADFWDEFGFAVLGIGILTVLIGAIVGIFMAAIAYATPDQVSDVGQGIVSSSSKSGLVQANAQYGEIPLTSDRLEEAGKTAWYLARAIQGGLDDVPLATKSLQLSSSFAVPDRLGNAQYPVFAVLVFSVSDLRQLNLKKVKGARVLNVAVQARAGTAEARAAIRQYCRSNGRTDGLERICATVLASPTLTLSKGR